MRTLNINNNGYVSTIRTNDLICEAHGKCYLDIAFEQNSTKIPSKVMLKCSGQTFTLPLHFSKLATEQLDGCYFDLSWFRYLAPKHNTRLITLEVYADSTLITTIVYRLTNGKGEVEHPVRTFTIEGIIYNEGDFFRVAPTQRTKHWTSVEMLCKQDIDNYLLVYWGNGNAEAEYDANGIEEVTDARNGGAFDDIFTILIDDYNEGISGIAYSTTIQDATCADIELRITNRHGLRGAIGGKFIDVTEGGESVQSNFGKFTSVAGVYDWSKKGAEIKKEVFFDFGGDADLLGLLRDACVYGQAEWYCEQSGEWLPCKVEQNSCDNDPFKEQSVTLTLQVL